MQQRTAGKINNNVVLLYCMTGSVIAWGTSLIDAEIAVAVNQSEVAVDT